MRAIGLVLRASICILALTASFAGAQQPGPIPPAITAAKTVFISNAGADSRLFPEPFSGDTNRAYNQFFSALRAMGKFDLVPDPSDADLVLELRLIAPYGPMSRNKQNGASNPVPMFRLVIYDHKTHYILWTITKSIGVALLQKTHDRNFDAALPDILLDFQRLAGKPPATANP